ncbi:type IV secretion protein Rhs [Actinoplanes cyaneus]|uniref:Type IV secretion protein Rhs n=1 Tax=Actinoplanes cyaneus TaxID=52696 RepID=A0A919MB38_9ACTN|nr:polymorphic toxin-type HINT domain-containing protein [Actinoplanes cyaneus]MCW2144482.1 intein C-terminal splicing region/RHS repeat-associated core domain-containing protein [Actinoplanes cyaneus]GID71183.1 type IV secretion protein Rhs [Actinoplanes cyaneus]
MLSRINPAPRLVSGSRRRVLAVALGLMLPALLNLVVAQGASAAPRDTAPPKPQELPRVQLSKNSRQLRQVTVHKKYQRFDPAGHAEAPPARSATVTLPTGAGTSAVAAATPIAVGRGATGAAPGKVRVTTADDSSAQAAGVRGVLFSLRAESGGGTVSVNVDESSFRNSYGGDFASRLHLVQLPACAMTTPRLAKCRTQTPVQTGAANPLTAQLKLATASAASALAETTTVLAATSSAEGSSGDYAATSLSPAGSWASGGNTGAFTYNYPITVPPSIAGAAPVIGLNYNSAAQDARTAGTNNQSSWIGDGWSSTENFVERTYRPCKDLKNSGAPDKSGDLCWGGQLLTLSLNGSSTQLVYDGGKLRPVSDSSTTKVEMLSNATNDTDNHEAFKVTEGGVQYYFGLNRLPGWSSGDDETKSVWTVPVYRANATNLQECSDTDKKDCAAIPGGPAACSSSSTFADTSCTLGYRFNLDYVVDLNGNAMAYYYAPETGYYGANGKDTAVEYVRGGVLKRIDYSMTASTVYSGTAPSQVLFTTAERCLTGVPAGNTCAAGDFTEAHPEYWPDTPIDLNCSTGKDCKLHGPSFWSRKRLTTIITQVQVGGETQKVDRYDLDQDFPDNGDHAPTLWLSSITHTGLDTRGGAAGSALAGTTSFTPRQLQNRVGTIPSMPSMFYHRIGTVISETGAESLVDYTTPDCTGVPASDLSDTKDTAAQKFASTNKTACFPVYWTPEGQGAPLIDWFYTHPVSRVTTIDRYNVYQDGTQPKLVTEYAYRGDPGWHYDDNEVTKARYRTWGQFRGYPEVDVTTGDTGVFHYTNKSPVHDQKTLTKTYYFLGMNGDTLPGGKTRPDTSLTSTDGGISVSDRDEFTGRAFETVTYTGATGSVDHSSVTVPMIIGPTASRSRFKLPALQAKMVRVTRTVNRQKVSYGWRTTEADTFYNTTLGQSTTGMPVQSVDRGEPGAAGNTPACSFTRYLDGTDDTLVVTAETIVTDQDCATAGASPGGTLLKDNRISYDGHAFAYNGDGQTSPARPTKGQPTLMQQASTASGAQATAFVNQSRTTYDSYGRILTATRTPDSTAPDGSSLAQVVLTRYSPASGALPVSSATVTQVTAGADCSAVTASTKDCQVSAITLDPARQSALATIDVAGQVTSRTYDGLGRVTAVWMPNRSKAAGATASMTYDYRLSGTAPTVVTTNTLRDDGGYTVNKILYDALLRPLETQATGANDSTVVSDTQYDSHGWTVLTNDGYAIDGTPGDTLISDHLSQVSIPATTVSDHDAMGRATQTTAEHNGVETWHSRSAYTGDTTTVIPPNGAVATTQTVDALGRMTQLQQYTTAPTVSGTPLGGFTTSGGVSQSIKYTYTAAGQQATVVGPDNATWKYGYDLRGRPTSQSDPDVGSSTTTFDDAGRITTTKDARSNELAYTYDLLGRKLTATDKASKFKFASWTYDTLRIGKPTSSTRYVPGVTGGYTVGVTGYTTLGNPLGTSISLPGAEDPLPLEYETKYAYTSNTEHLAQQQDPAAGGLPGETITYKYDLLGQPKRTSGIDLYVADSTYTDFGQPSRVAMGASTNQAEVIYAYDEYTLRLTGRTVSRAQAPGPVVDETAYTYDDAGNPLSVTNLQSETGNTVKDTQCYRYDSLDRLADAWTANGDCPNPATAQPSADQVATGPGAYWQTFTYNAIGSRTRLVDHGINGAADATTDYTLGCAAACNRTGAQPHTLTAATGSDPAKLTYDVSGNLLTRTPASGNGQKLEWDKEGHLATVTTTGATPTVTKYLYDADGNQLIRRDPGRTTLFAGDTQVVINTSVTPAVSLGAVRTYSHGGSGSAVAVRSTLPGGGTDYLFNDPHGTAALAMDTTSQQISRQQYKPYGGERRSANTLSWPDMTRGYLGAVKDVATGYTDLGARKYDPALGRFISADPVLQVTDPNQLGGYTYAGDNPITGSDPTGTTNEMGGGGGRACPQCNGTMTGGTGTSSGQITTPSSGSSGSGSSGSSGSSSGGGGGGGNGGSGGGNGGNSAGGNGGGGVVDKGWRFVKTLGKDGFGLLQSAQNSNPVSCAVNLGIDGCIEQHKGTAKFAWDFVSCGFGSCDGINRDMDCSNGWTAECAGNVTFFLGSLAIGGRGAGARAAAGEAATDAAATAEAAATDSAAAGAATDAAAKAGQTVSPRENPAGNGGPQPKGCNSFAPTTLVLMADGSTKSIDEVKLGDEVLATDPDTGETAAHEVTALHVNTDTALADLTVETDDGAAVVHTTQEHPFWSQQRHRWVTTNDLLPGETLGAAVPMAPATVDGVRAFAGQQRMFNLTVDGVHTYYVLAGKTPVLVHNTGPLCGPHGGASGSPAGVGVVEGPAPAKAFDMLDKVKSRTGGIGKVSGYDGNGSWANKAGDLPGGAYREWDVNATADLPVCSFPGCSRPIRGEERLLTPKSGSGSAYYTPDHYGTFYYVGEFP